MNLAYSTTSQTRQTYLAHQWAEPRSIGTRYAAAIADLSSPQRSSLLADLAAATTHWAVPAAERNHLLITMHHGHLQGARTSAKAAASGAPPASRPGTNTRTPPPTPHTSRPIAREVWAKLARAWEDATGESLDVSHPRLTVLGLRPTLTKHWGIGPERCEQSEHVRRQHSTKDVTKKTTDHN